MSLLSLVQNACDRLTLTRPSGITTSTDQTILTLFGLAQQEGKELAKRHTWQVLTGEQTFTSTATTVQATALPSDFDRFIDDTFYNRTRKRPVYGPLDPQEWQFIQGVVSTTIVEAFRQRGDSVMLTPTPSAGDTYAYEYVKKNWCESSLGTDQAAWASDTDVGILNEELMTLGVVWRFKSAKGLDYAEEFRSYELMVAQAIARDGGKPTLYAGARVRRGMPRMPFTQEGSWAL